MKTLSLGDMSSFKCIGSSCPFHCCKYWSIDIDSQTEAYYKSIEGEFGEKLRNNIITTDDKTFFKLNESGNCEFLNSDNLCDIYINLGPENMCKTCQDYPRLSGTINPDTYIKYMTMSCPEVSRLWLSQTEPSKLMEHDNKKDHNFDISQQTQLKKIISGFETSLNILYNPKLSMPDKLRLIIYFNELYTNKLKEKQSAPEVLNLFSSNENLAFLKDNITPIKADSIKMHKWILKMSIFFMSLEANYSRVLLVPIIESIQQRDSKDYPDIAEMISTLYKEGDMKHFENLFAHILFRNYFFALKDLDTVTRLRSPLYLYYFQICILAYIRYQANKPLTLNDMVMTITLISRNLEHSKKGYKEFLDLSRDVLGGETADLLSITF